MKFALLNAGLVCGCVLVILAGPASAAPITYTFSGTGDGTIGTTSFQGDFSFTFTGDTSNITSGGGEFFNGNIGGTFTQGSYSATLLADNLIVDNNDSSFPRLGFFNSLIDNGGTIQNILLASYQLDTSLSPITETGTDLLPTLNSSGDGFDTVGGDVIELLGVTSLTASASLPSTGVPEPLTISLLGAGVAGAAAMRRRRAKKA